ncbi:MAG: metalloregulator ArsR/SmtB family transcription factor [bacterium]
MNSDAVRSTLRVTKALADIQRVRILMMLGAGELCVCQIVEVLALAPSTVSKHLSILSAARLVDMRKEGRWAYYRLPEGTAGAFARPVLKWLDKTLKNDGTIEQDAKNLRRVLVCDPGSLCRQQRKRE